MPLLRHVLVLGTPHTPVVNAKSCLRYAVKGSKTTAGSFGGPQRYLLSKAETVSWSHQVNSRRTRTADRKRLTSNVSLSVDSHVHVPCPYQAGTRLSLFFFAESATSPVLTDIIVVKPFEPFTLAQVMLVEKTSPNSELPDRFIIKLLDPRFASPRTGLGLNRTGWTLGCDRMFKEGINNVRDSTWNNYWTSLGASTDVPTWNRDNLDDDADVEELSRSEEDWIEEMDRWAGLRRTRDTEVAMYRHLQALQGEGIPRLYGTCLYTANDGSPNLDPFIANVPGLALEYIDGTSMDKLIPGKHITEDDAERASQGLLAILRNIRDRYVLHDDLYLRNVIMRPHDPDHPVVIDFGNALVRDSPPGGPDSGGEYTHDEWVSCMSSVQDAGLEGARIQLAKAGYHHPSPVPEQIDDRADVSLTGYADTNWEIDHMLPELRAQYYEPIPDPLPNEVRPSTSDPEKQYIWEHPRWRIKPGVQTANASADYLWGKREQYAAGPVNPLYIPSRWKKVFAARAAASK